MKQCPNCSQMLKEVETPTIYFFYCEYCNKLYIYNINGKLEEDNIHSKSMIIEIIKQREDEGND